MNSSKKNPCSTVISLALSAALLACSALARAGGFFVTSVIREIPMTSGDKAPVDYYVNAGSSNGMRKGLILEAVRKIPVYDNVNSKLNGDVSVRIARLRLIHVDKASSIARLVKMNDRAETPLAGFGGVMVGDSIEVAEKQ